MTTLPPNIDTGSVNAGPVIVPVPRDTDLATEPARTIAKAMELKKAILGVLAVSGVLLAPELSDNIDLIIQSVIVLAYSAYAVWGAFQQGEQTRAAVYSPASAAAIAESSQADVVPGDPKHADVPAGGVRPSRAA